MEFGLNDEQRLLIRGVRDFIEGELAPLEEEIATSGPSRSGQSQSDIQQIQGAWLLRDEYSRRVWRRRAISC